MNTYHMPGIVQCTLCEILYQHKQLWVKSQITKPNLNLFLSDCRAHILNQWLTEFFFFFKGQVGNILGLWAMWSFSQ